MVIFNSFLYVYQRVAINGLGLSHQESISGHRAAELWKDIESSRKNSSSLTLALRQWIPASVQWSTVATICSLTTSQVPFGPFWKELRLDRVATHRIQWSKHVKTERLTCPLPLATSLVRSYCPGTVSVPTNVALVLYPHWQRLRQQKNWAIAWAGSFFMASFAEERVFGSCLHCTWRNLQESAHRVERSSPDVAVQEVNQEVPRPRNGIMPRLKRKIGLSWHFVRFVWFFGKKHVYLGSYGFV